ncbi:SseB family protein [Rhodovulum sp. DZ06]|uniref:SseB family protein n=1 Tax=Rhodovulum sp. DZ06 TaxID=3425126 RepID=UPI003D33F0FF
MTDAATPLDRAVLAARDAGQAPETAGRVADALLAAPLWLLLEEEPGTDDSFKPRLLELEAGPTALAFDAEDRLAEFADGPVAHIQIPGRALVSTFAGSGVCLAVNPGVAESELFWDAATVDWAAEALAGEVEAEAARPEAIAAPGPLPPGALELLGPKLAALAPSLAEAWLTEAQFSDGSARLLLVLRLNGAEKADEATRAEAEAATARALADTGRLAGASLPELDAAFAVEGEPLLERARRLGLGVDLPEPQKPARRAAPKAPGSDPDAPPILR